MFSEFLRQFLDTNVAHPTPMYYNFFRRNISRTTLIWKVLIFFFSVLSHFGNSHGFFVNTVKEKDVLNDQNFLIIKFSYVQSVPYTQLPHQEIAFLLIHFEYNS